MSEDKLAKIKLFRFDPEVNDKPWYQEFEVSYEGRTVLDVLRYIYENLDSTFAFRWACDEGYCGSCVVSVNGKPAFACAKSAEKNMKIEPHPKFEIIKDLMIDFDRPKKSPEE